MGELAFGWPPALDMRYDRRVDAAFVELFRGGGLYGSVTEYAREARYPVDLQFRREIRADAQRATLYVGLQKVLDIEWRDGEVRLTGHSRLARRCGFRSEWSAWTSQADARRTIDGVEGYLELVIPQGAASAKEGAVQSAVSAFHTDGTFIVDREVSLQYRSRAVRSRLIAEWTDDLVALLIDAPVPQVSPPRFGDRCDIVALSRADEVLAIEVKPRNVESVVWAPAQAIVYARMLNAWIEADLDAVGILQTVVDTRVRLNLIDEVPPAIVRTARVRPVLAVQRGGGPERLESMRKVIRYLRESGVPEAHELLLFDVSLSGRLIASE